MKVVTLTSKILAPAVAQELGVEFIRIPYKPFSDGECKYILHKNLKNEEICYIQSFYPDQFASILRTCFLVDLLNQRKASYIKAFIPYLSFQRQDKPRSYESRNAKVVMEILSKSGIDNLWTVDAHSEIVLRKYSFFRGNLDPSYCIANYLRERGFDNSLIVAPDDNAERKMVIIADALNLPYVMLHKYRDEQDHVHFKESSIKTDLKSAIIVDDVVAGGSTLKGTARILRKSSVEEIYAVVTHALVSEETELELSKVGIKEIISTDSIENKFSKISLAPLIADLFKF